MDSIKTQLANYKFKPTTAAFIEKNGTSCYDTDSVPDSVKKLYGENGGNAYLDELHTMRLTEATRYLQVIDGMDIVDKIASAKVDKDDIPVKNIVIKALRLHNIRNQQLRQIRHLPASHSPTTVG